MADTDHTTDTFEMNGQPGSDTPRFYQRKDIYCDDITEEIGEHVYEIL